MELDFKMNNIITHRLFPVPIFEYRLKNYEQLNKELEQYIYSLKEIDPTGMKKSNAGGWHSPFFIIKESKAVQKFIASSHSFVADSISKEMGWKFLPEKTNITNMWSVINSKNTFNIRHNHPNSLLSAAYYVKAKKNSGSICFFDPKEARTMRRPLKDKDNDLNADTIKVEPLEGNLLLFPSYLHHSVDENLSDEDRIVISFNLDVR